MISLLTVPILRLFFHKKSEPILPKCFRVFAEFILAPVYIMQRIINLISEKYKMGKNNPTELEQSKRLMDEVGNRKMLSKRLR